MGRVAKYKKVKSFDPYSKKNRGNVDLSAVGVWGLGDNGRKKKKRSLKAQKLHAKKHRNSSKKKGTGGFDDDGFDVPPDEEDEFTMADLVGSIKKKSMKTNEELLGDSSSSLATTTSSFLGASSSVSNDKTEPKNNKTADESYDTIVTSSGNVANIPKTDQDEKKIERLLRVEEQMEQKSKLEKQQTQGRMEGESKRAYAKRTRAETREIIKQSTTTVRNLEKLQKKKEFLKNKKNKKRKGGAAYYDDEVDYDKRRSTRTAIKANQEPEAPVRFNEQAERPPIFRQIPRGAKSKKPKTATSMASLSKTKGMTDHQIEGEKDAMELMRRRIQAQYKAIKQKRRDTGDFHL
ncbi:unnamed protein product [Pseudo-nitzschia multistriata]|uniref:Uncharacterized protein n=1 Tax=Pseudo-nitzschia multistriata TaxID=183589 RepID=A0A448ZAI1_9STRA|nr:unnamed protein product [Pseudo-nitzschia multistriata]